MTRTLSHGKTMTRTLRAGLMITATLARSTTTTQTRATQLLHLLSQPTLPTLRAGLAPTLSHGKTTTLLILQ